MRKRYSTQIKEIIQEKIVGFNGNIAIYPFGRRGKLVKEILNNEFDIHEKYIIDNNIIDSNILSLENFLTMNDTNCLLLICTDNNELKKEIKNDIRTFNKRQIIDMLPEDIQYCEEEDGWIADKGWLEEDILRDIHVKADLLVFEKDNRLYDIIKELNEDVLLKLYEDFLCAGSISAGLGRAYNLFMYLLKYDVKVNKNDLLVGELHIRKWGRRGYQPVSEIKCTLQNSKATVSAYNMGLFFSSIGGHVVPNYEILLKSGIDKLLEDINILYKMHKRKNFYKAEMISLRALQEFILRYGQKAFKENRQDLGDMLFHIAHDKPENFMEAVQLLWLQHEVMVAEGDISGISIGRLDQILYPFYKKDVNEGKITNDSALDILCSFWNKFEAPRELITFANVTLGGGICEGVDGANELTLLCMEAQNRVRHNQPMLSLRTNEYTDNQVWDKALEVIATGMGVPSLFNDKVVTEAKQRTGVSKEDAYNYAIIGCVEPTIPGREYSHTEGLRINWCKIMELMFFQGVCPSTGNSWSLKNKRDLSEIGSFEYFYQWYKEELVYAIEYGCKLIQETTDTHGKTWSAPYLSLFMEGCMEKGIDVTEGGTKYNNLTVNFAGMANTVNSLYVIKKLVYEEKFIELEKIPNILRNDFKQEDEFLEMIRVLPKYGQDFDEIDRMMKELIELSINTIEKYNCDRGGMFQAGFYTVHLHAAMGEKMVATPDGRRKGKALASSLSPAQGTDTKGILAVFNSLTKQPLSHMGNGMVLDVKFTKQAFENECQREKMREVIKTYFEKGGYEIQINVVNKDTLVKAQKKPEEYRNLLVRVSGFSTYFVELNKTTQDEIIARTELG